MNKTQKKKLERIASVLEDLMSDLYAISDEEREKYDNSPGNLQDSERVQRYQEIADTLDSIGLDIDCAVHELRVEVIDY